MNTEVGVWLWSKDDAAAEAAIAEAPAFFEEVEQALSRFRDDSDLSQLNAAAGLGPQAASPILFEVVALALATARELDGLFDPAILPALRAAGYGPSFEQIGEALAPPLTSRHTWRDVQASGGSVSLPRGAALDLGGLAKGWTVDALAERLKPLGPVMVDAGGDIRAFGPPWPVAIGDPFSKRHLAVVELKNEAIATSSVGKRRWLQDGQWRHHLIDPRTQKPSASDVHTATVLGPSARVCEVNAKVALLLGSQVGARHLEAQGLNGVLVLHDGRYVLAGARLASKPA